MTEPGLRARKKAQLRKQIADTAARLFAAEGYDTVTVRSIAMAADVAEKTVYNYFPTKEDLVLDQDEDEVERLSALLRHRPPGTSPATAIRPDALRLVASIGAIPPDQVHGVVDYLAATHPRIRAACLEMTDRHAAALTEVLLAEFPRRPGEVFRARMRAYAGGLAWIYQSIIDESGRRLVAGNDPRTTARQVRTVVVALLDDLEQVPVPSPSRAVR